MKRPIVATLLLIQASGPLLPAAEVPYGQLKGDSLKEVLKPVPPKEPAEALRSLEVIAGFSVEFAAHEPLVLDPVAAAIDENGLMYVAEDADYPYRPAEGESPKGRIRLLIDKDADGFYEDSHLFAEGLLWPAGVAPWKGGVFVTAPPDIWYLKDTNGDFRADIKEKVFTGFGSSGSQYILNNLQWGLDHKIYAAVAGNGGRVSRPDDSSKSVSVARKDFRFDPVTRRFESISGGKQFGNTFDDWGNRFLCTQDTPVYQEVFAEKYLERNPLLEVSESTPRLVQGGAPIFRTSPIEAWRAIRSSRRLLANRGSPTQSGVSHHVLDGVAGVTVYRGGAFPESFYGNVFCGDAQNNLVHRRSLVRDGVLFRCERLDSQTEFLRSKDLWFRPVNFVNAPDGTLYVLDMAREVLEAVHIPMDVVKHLDLTSGRDRGRIYRVIPDGFKRPPQPRLGEFTTAQLVACLESPHGWWRDTAHRLIFERQDKAAEAPLRRLLQNSSRPQARLHALWSLQGLDSLSERDILKALADDVPALRENALRLAEPKLDQSAALLERGVALANDLDARVRFQLALTLGEPSHPDAVKGLARIAKQDAGDDFIRTAILSSSAHCASSLLTELLRDSRFIASRNGTVLFRELARFVAARKKPDEILPVLSTTLKMDQPNLQPIILIGLSDGLREAGDRLGTWTAALDAAALERYQRIMDNALRTIADPVKDVERVKIALQLSENAPTEKATRAITNLLDRFPPAAIQVAAVQTLSRLAGPGLEDVLLKRWRENSPEARREILAVLLTKKEWTGALLAALESGRISPGEMDATSRSALLRHGDADIQRRAAVLWGSEKAGTRQEVIQKYRASLDLKGHAEAGQNTFQRLCSLCHRLNGAGNELGPNLSLAATRSPDELLAQILDPNLEVNPAFVQYTVETADGETFSGLMVGDRADSVTIKGVNFEHTIPRQRIGKIASEGQSLMPVGLEQGLDLQEMADLLAFLIESRYDAGTSGRSSSRDVPDRR